MGTINVTPSQTAIDRIIENKQNLINDSLNFLSLFSENEDGEISDEVYMLCYKIGVKEQTLQYLQNLLSKEQIELNEMREL